MEDVTRERKSLGILRTLETIATQRIGLQNRSEQRDFVNEGEPCTKLRIPIK